MNVIARLKGWRTVLTGVLITLTGVVTGLTGDPVVGPFLTDHFSSVLAWLGIAMIVLRAVTTTPVGEVPQGNSK